jgi:hypothetical protein
MRRQLTLYVQRQVANASKSIQPLLPPASSIPPPLLHCPLPTRPTTRPWVEVGSGGLVYGQLLSPQRVAWRREHVVMVGRGACLVVMRRLGGTRT